METTHAFGSKLLISTAKSVKIHLSLSELEFTKNWLED